MDPPSPAPPSRPPYWFGQASILVFESAIVVFWSAIVVFWVHRHGKFPKILEKISKIRATFAENPGKFQEFCKNSKNFGKNFQNPGGRHIGSRRPYWKSIFSWVDAYMPPNILLFYMQHPYPKCSSGPALSNRGKELPDRMIHQ